MAKKYFADNVSDAIELAYKLKNSGNYDLFRGQALAEWKPHTTFVRLALANQNNWDEVYENYRERFKRFLLWLENTSGLEDISESEEATFAVAQHYGLETDYLDFTTDPAIAGFFSCDSEFAKSGAISCIYCLNSQDLLKIWEMVRQVRLENGEDFVNIRLVDVHVPNLWRLQAQKGKFLYAPTNWEVIYPMDRIMFPYTDFPSYPIKSDIYPDRKSALEILLDQYFDNEKKLEHNQWFNSYIEKLESDNVTIIRAESASLNKFFDEGFVLSRKIKEHSSWNQESYFDWLKVDDEKLDEINFRELTLFLSSQIAINQVVDFISRGIINAIKSYSNLRSCVVSWKIQSDSVDVLMLAQMEKGLNALWDGFRSTPVKDESLAKSLGVWIGLCVAGFNSEMKPTEEVNVVKKILGPFLKVEFSSNDGASSKGYASNSLLRKAFRSDLQAQLSHKGLECLNEESKILLIIWSPRYLFDFDHLVELFVTQIAPTQMIRSTPHFYHPARLSRFGLP